MVFTSCHAFLQIISVLRYLANVVHPRSGRNAAPTEGVTTKELILFSDPVGVGEKKIKPEVEPYTVHVCVCEHMPLWDVFFSSFPLPPTSSQPIKLQGFWFSCKVSWGCFMGKVLAEL